MNYFNNKRILITGATGLIGSHLVLKLFKETNATLVLLSRNLEKLRVLFKDFIDSDRIELIALDVTEQNYLNGVFDIIFHTASPIDSDTIKNRPYDVISPNVIAIDRFIKFLDKQKKQLNIDGKLVIFSSATVYANNTNNDIIVNENDTSISDTLDAMNSPYSESKRMIEIMGKSACKQYGISCVICRFSYLYGPSLFPSKTAIYSFINDLIAGKNILINSGNLPRRDNIFIDDAIEGVFTIVKNGKDGESYNISSNGEKDNFCSVDEMALILVNKYNELKNSNFKVIYNEKRSRRKPGICLNNKKLEMFGWRVNTSVEKGIEKMLNYYLDNNK